MSSPPAFTGSDAPQPPVEELEAAGPEDETLQHVEQAGKQVAPAEEPSSPGKSHLKDWEILNAGTETKMQVVKDLPRQVKEQVMKMQPAFQGASKPVLQKLEQCWKTAAAAQGEFAEQYPTDDVLKAGLAVALLFSGGRFSLTIACAQSFHMACWERLKKTCQDVQDSYVSVSGQRSVQDAGLLADITRIVKALVLAKSASDREEVMRRSLNIVKCIDAYKTRDVLDSLWPGVVAVIATLRSRFAFAAGLGANMGQIAFETMQTGSWLQQMLKQSSAEGWTKVGIQQSCMVVSFCLSFYMTSVMNSLNSALQGSTALTKVLFQYILCQKILPESSRSTIGKCALPLLGSSPEMGKEEEVVKWSLAMIGFYVQVRRQHQFPLLVKAPMAPLYLMEHLLARLARASF